MSSPSPTPPFSPPLLCPLLLLSLFLLLSLALHTNKNIHTHASENKPLQERIVHYEFSSHFLKMLYEGIGNKNTIETALYYTAIQVTRVLNSLYLCIIMGVREQSNWLNREVAGKVRRGIKRAMWQLLYKHKQHI